jgi:hypothetical protein
MVAAMVASLVAGLWSVSRPVQTEDEPGVAWADSDALVDKITDVYERLPGEIQAEVPLRRIWTLVPDED